MTESLQARIETLVQQVFACGPDAWLLWCDPLGHWLPLLRAAALDASGGFTLLEVDETTAGEFGSPAARRRLQAQIDTHTPFVLYAAAAPQDLGWLWAQTLLAERVYSRTLRSQLLDWGWRPHSLTMSDDEVAALARARRRQDPAGWGGGALQPDVDLLLAVLAGLEDPTDDNRLILELSREAAGLPEIDAGDLGLWRTRSLARLLVTQAQEAAPGLVPAGHELLVPAERRTFALQLLGRWVDSNALAPALSAAVLQADRIAQLGAPAAAAAGATAGVPAAVVQPFVSQAAEQAFFAALCKGLAEQAGRPLLEGLAGMAPLLERHAQGFWGRRQAAHAQAVHWGELQRLAAAAQELIDATPAAPWPSVDAAVAWYTGGGWRMDRAGEQLTRNLTVTTPDLLRLIAPLRSVYRARWEDTLIRWSQIWSDAGCPLPAAVPTAGTWLKASLEGAHPSTAILVLDALRYDLGATLVERLNTQEGVQRGEVRPARSPLPSITALGMGMALPIAEDQLAATIVDGKWRLAAAGSSENLSVAEQRRAWWQANVPHTQIVDFDAVLAGQAPAPGAGCRRLVIHDAAIDAMGHDDQLAFQGSEPALKRYLGSIELLRSRGWRRILVVTDHGYLHRTVDEEKNTDPPAPNPAYAARRALAYTPDTALPRPSADAPGGRWRVALPRGAASFRAYGGLGYFHGGASLQEWIIPCLAVEWPQAAQPVQVSLDPLSRILSVRPKVVLRVEGASLLREDNIARQVEIVIRSQQAQTVLFRSDVITATVDTMQQEVVLSAVPGASAERSTPVNIEVRDPRSEERLHVQGAVLSVELSGW